MKIENKVIGFAGVAGAGKDLFFKILKEKVPNVKKYALAYHVKDSLYELCATQYEIDSHDCVKEEKELIRPMLCAHGNIMRKLSNGRHWIDRTMKFMEYDKKDEVYFNKDTIVCITDIRFDEYKKDEVHWLKEELGGIFVHVSKYTRRGNKRCYHPPANQFERENDPKLKKAADYLVTWPEYKGSQKSIEKKLEKYVDKFILKFNIK
tara:strand:+ start:1006 stop:1626 length:621 start_codon:yes stop_codon:yes gene_type:complete